jgi:hypothetical protein
MNNSPHLQKSIPVLINDSLIIWTPNPGMDPSILSSDLLLGARVYANEKMKGMSESICHILAEKAVFESYYNVSYK